VAKSKAGTCVAGTTMEIMAWEVEVADPISEASFISGAALAGGAATAVAATAAAAAAAAGPSAARSMQRPFKSTTSTAARAVAARDDGANAATNPLSTPVPAAPIAPAAPTGPKSLHDPDREGALLLSSAGDMFPKTGRATVGVVVDPFIGASLRPHQRDGVKFMYECVMGLRRDVVSGAAHTGCLLVGQHARCAPASLKPERFSCLDESSALEKGASFKTNAPVCTRLCLWSEATIPLVHDSHTSASV